MRGNHLSILFAAAALLAAPVAFRPAPGSPANAWAENLGRGELIGRVVHRVGTFHRTMQVMVQGQEWTINVPGGIPITGDHNYPRSVHDIHDNIYVRAIGTRIGPLRLRADRIFIVGDRLALVRHGYPRSGYYASYAGYRSRYRRHYR